MPDRYVSVLDSIVPTVADVLNAAADNIEDDPTSWIRGKGYCDGRGGFCLLAHVNLAAGRNPCESVEPDERYAIQRALGSFAIAPWNDEPGRTADEVVNVLRFAAITWDADHA